MKFKVWLEAIDLKVGQIIDIPAQDNRYPIKVKIAKIRGDKVWLTQYLDKDDLIGAFTMTRTAVQHFVNDLTGKVEVNKTTDDPYINKVLQGKATYLGKGDDGVVFDTGEMIVKVSTTVPYVPTNPFHRTPATAARGMLENVRLTEALRKQGVPGILPTYVKIVGDKAFAVRPKVEIHSLNREQFEETRKLLQALHKAGYAVRDEIQVGTYQGKIYHFDLGKIGKGDAGDFRHDMSMLELLASRSNIKMVDRDWEHEMAMAPLMARGDEGEKRGYIRHLMRVKKNVIKQFPEREAEIEAQFQQTINSL